MRGPRGGILEIPSFSSHGGAREGAGRKRHHQRTNDFLRISIYELHRLRALRNGAHFTATHGNKIFMGFRVTEGLILVKNDFATTVKITWTQCNLGGSRQWFQCPNCIGRIAILYADSSSWACAKCRQLRYQCQSEDWIARGWRREYKLRSKLAPGGFGRRRRMHQSTYSKIFDEIVTCHETRMQMSTCLAKFF